jgi:outer membrane protein TolC
MQERQARAPGAADTGPPSPPVRGTCERGRARTGACYGLHGGAATCLVATVVLSLALAPLKPAQALAADDSPDPYAPEKVVPPRNIGPRLFTDDPDEAASEESDFANDWQQAYIAGGRAWTLDELVARALTNEEVMLALTRQYEAQSLQALANAQWYPTGEVQLIVAPGPEAKGDVLNAFPAPSRNQIAFGTPGVMFRANLSLVQPIYTFGKIGWAQDAGAYAVKAAGYGVEYAKANVRANVRKAFWGLVLARRLRKILEEGRDKALDIRKTVADLLEDESGDVTETDRERVEFYVNTVEGELISVDEAIRQAVDALRFFCRIAPTEPFDVTEQEPRDALPTAPDPAEALSVAWDNRPDLKALKMRARASEAFWKSTRSAYYPDLFLAGVFRYSINTAATDQTNPFVRDDYNYLEAGLGLGLRITLDIPVKRAKAMAAEADWRKAQWEYDMAARGTNIDVRRKQAVVALQQRRLENAENGEKSAKRWVVGELLNYEVGVGDTRALVEGLTVWYTSRSLVERNLYNVIVAGIDLDQALGRR